MMPLVLVAAAQLADLVTFFAAASVIPISNETNVLAGAAWNLAGPIGVMSLKLAALIPSLMIVDRLSHVRVRWVPLAAVSIPAGIGLAGAAGNVAALLAALR